MLEPKRQPAVRGAPGSNLGHTKGEEKPRQPSQVSGPTATARMALQLGGPERITLKKGMESR